MVGMKLVLMALVCCGMSTAADLPVGGISHVGYRVADLDRTRAFYRDVLGFQQAFPQADATGRITGAVIKINDDQFLEFGAGLAAGGGDRFTHLAFLSESLEPLRTVIETLGLKPPVLRTGRDRTRNFSIQDPDGHRIEFVRYEADSLQAEARGKFADDRRISTHLDRVGIAVEDRARAAAFFHGQLGFAENGALLNPVGAPRNHVELLPAGAASQFYLDVANVEKALATLHARGMKGDTIVDPDGMRILLKTASR
jgi:catechol 2,3-dioxygenase-like lactoylglutathione lyase family enzyme